MTPLDRQLFFAINHGLNCGVNDIWIGYATWLGNGWIGFPIAIVALFFANRESFWRNVLTLAVAAVVGGVALNLIKQAVHAPRPLTVFATDIATGKVYINVLFDRFYWNSFPSGHTQTAFTIATMLAYAGRNTSRWNVWKSIGIFLIAALVALSRVYCGAHFPSDVIAGAALGATTGSICCVAVSPRQAQRRHFRSLLR